MELGFSRSRRTRILLKEFIRFVDNVEIGKSGFILRNEVAGGALKLNDLSTSLHRHSAIHGEDLARDVTSLWSGQK